MYRVQHQEKSNQFVLGYLFYSEVHLFRIITVVIFQPSLQFVIFQKACELLLDVLASLPEGGATPDTTNQKSPSPTAQGRQLLLMQCIESEVLPYCIQLIISCLKVCVQ